jgi:hypothetical protein
VKRKGQRQKIKLLYPNRTTIASYLSLSWKCLSKLPKELYHFSELDSASSVPSRFPSGSADAPS